MNEKKPYTIFMLVKTTAEWLKLKPSERIEFARNLLEPLLQKYASVKMRFFDGEAFNARVTDILVWETSDLKQYEYLVENLRESLFWETYFEIVEIIPAVENAYADYYEVEPIS
jgi:hypothetical protein